MRHVGARVTPENLLRGFLAGLFSQLSDGLRCFELGMRRAVLFDRERL